MSTYTRRAHTRTVNGRTIQVRASTVSRRPKVEAAAAPKYRRSTWVGTTGIGVLMGGGKAVTAGFPTMGGVVGLIGLVLVLVAGVMRMLKR